MKREKTIIFYIGITLVVLLASVFASLSYISYDRTKKAKIEKEIQHRIDSINNEKTLKQIEAQRAAFVADSIKKAEEYTDTLAIGCIHMNTTRDVFEKEKRHFLSEHPTLGEYRIAEIKGIFYDNRLEELYIYSEPHECVESNYFTKNSTGWISMYENKYGDRLQLESSTGWIQHRDKVLNHDRAREEISRPLSLTQEISMSLPLTRVISFDRGRLYCHVSDNDIVSNDPYYKQYCKLKSKLVPDRLTTDFVVASSPPFSQKEANYWKGKLAIEQEQNRKEGRVLAGGMVSEQVKTLYIQYAAQYNDPIRQQMSDILPKVKVRSQIRFVFIPLSQKHVKDETDRKEEEELRQKQKDLDVI